MSIWCEKASRLLLIRKRVIHQILFKIEKVNHKVYENKLNLFDNVLYYFILEYWDISTQENLGFLASEMFCTGECTLIWRIWVSRPFWWFDNTAICIMNVLIGLSCMSLRGMIIHPDGSCISTCSTSVKSLKWFPALIDILK